MARVHDCLDMWQGYHNVCATQKEYHAQNSEMTAVRYISDTEDIVKDSWWMFHHVSAAAFQLSEWSSCHQLGLQRISMEYKSEYSISAE